MGNETQSEYTDWTGDKLRIQRGGNRIKLITEARVFDIKSPDEFNFLIAGLFTHANALGWIEETPLERIAQLESSLIEEGRLRSQVGDSLAAAYDETQCYISATAACHKLIDAYEGQDPSVSSLECLEDRVKALITKNERLKKSDAVCVTILSEINHAIKVMESDAQNAREQKVRDGACGALAVLDMLKQFIEGRRVSDEA